ncbi:transcriptional regulator [Pedobacter yulinensis]|uniref:Transcriptional regulator n=1 Tax=Pedobacter yulinensis TaxID=2126353 RepID=A0A2T3HJG0_9SPHI|nr:helix-turn-helix domain-containing protein [Pedobacter yulinensis]PST82588.1 transcriptional regulator [Pedobacter yulinensis]
MTRKQNSTYSSNEKYLVACDLTYALQKIHGRWKLQILDKLKDGRLRYNELRREFSHITERMLTLQLRSMEHDGLISRTVYAEVPVRVEYGLTEIATELGPILNQLSLWGRKQRQKA